MLVQCGESQTDLDLLVSSIASGLEISNLDHFLVKYEGIGPYIFVDNLPYEADHSELIKALEHLSFDVWLVTEPNSDGFHEIMYWHGQDIDRAVDLMQKLVHAMEIEKLAAE